MAVTKSTKSSSSRKTSKKTGNVTDTIPISPRFYDIPILPLYEIIFYFVVWIGHSLFACIQTYRASVLFKTELIFVQNGKDVGDYEWSLWTNIGKTIIVWMIIHSVLFSLLEKYAQNTWKPLMLIYWMIAHCAIYGHVTILVTVSVGVVVLLVTIICPTKYTVWATVAVLLIQSENILTTNDQHSDVAYYVNLWLFAYKMLQYLSYCMHLVETDKRCNIIFSLYEMLWYSFYLPYSTMLIVIYEDFQRQISDPRRQEPKNWSHPHLTFVAFRVSFWILFNEIVLHYFYMNAFMQQPNMLGKLDDSSTLSVGYTVGQFFQTKYTAIFGFYALFAFFDGMTPPWPPICISRVSLYSNMWRYFDRGLYSFLKKYIYHPLVGPQFPLKRRISAVILSYIFVVAWHGARKRLLYWVSLNFFEVILEQIGFAFYCQPRVKKFIDDHFSPTNFRRIVALLQNFCVPFGIFGIWYFLGAEGAGEFLVRKVWWEEGLKFDWRFWYIIALGYCFNQCCMEIQRLERRKQN